MYYQSLGFMGSSTSLSKVNYICTDQTSGTPPVDSSLYSLGQTVTVLGKNDLYKLDNRLTGWYNSRVGSKLPGSTFLKGSSDDNFIAQWGTAWSDVGVVANWFDTAVCASGQYMYAVSNQGLHKSSDYGQTFSLIVSDTTMRCLDCSSDGSIIHVGTTSDIKVYTNYGTYNRNFMATGHISSIRSSDTGAKFIASAGLGVSKGYIWVGMDAATCVNKGVQGTGATSIWTRADISADGTYMSVMDFTNHFIYISINGGTSFGSYAGPILQSPGYYGTAVSRDGKYIFVTITNGGVYRASTTNINTAPNWVDITPNDSNKSWNIIRTSRDSSTVTITRGQNYPPFTSINDGTTNSSTWKPRYGLSTSYPNGIGLNSNGRLFLTGPASSSYLRLLDER